MGRAPRLRTVTSPRRLHCGHRVGKGVTIATKGRAWLCAQCQPWLPARTHEQVLAAARDAEPRATAAAPAGTTPTSR